MASEQAPTKKTVLVTGGAGFVGTNLVKRLINDGYEVICVDNYRTGLKANHTEGCKYIDADIRDMKDYPAVSAVFHMAAISRIQPSFSQPVDYFTTNANGTLNLVQWCAKNDVPMIYAGTSSKHSGKFKNPYTFSKDVGEDLVQLFQQHFNLQASVARFYNVYGPHQLLTGGYTTLIGRWLHQIEHGEQCYIYGDGLNRRDFTHIDDIVDALILVMEKKAYGHEFELGRGKNYSVNEVAKMFGISPEYMPPKPGEARITLNTDKTARDVLGWNPTRDLDDYVAEQAKRLAALKAGGKAKAVDKAKVVDVAGNFESKLTCEKTF